MRCPTFDQLPLPPLGKTGWPWTEESLQLPDTMPDGCPWPRVSIVTPSYNQGEFIEETIRSVLLQGYPNLEYIIMDGGSTDSSVDIIRKYEKWLTYWVSEPDEGQADAINKGFIKSTGEILAWLNSDDTYELGALITIAEHFQNNPDVDVVYGNINLIDGGGRVVKRWLEVGFSKRRFIYGAAGIPQPATFFRKAAFMQAGMLRKEFFFALDADLWLRMCLKGAHFCYLRKTLANFRFHNESKTSKYQAVARAEARRFRQELLGLDDQRLSFRMMHWLHLRLWRPILLICQGDAKYIREGIVQFVPGQYGRRRSSSSGLSPHTVHSQAMSDKTQAKRYKVAIVAPVPFYYHAPLYRQLARYPEIDLRVYYCSDETLRGAEVSRMYRSRGRLASEEELLNGYPYKFLKNYSPAPSFMRWPFGLINPGIWWEIRRGNCDAIVLQSWTNLTWWIAFFACLRYKTPVVFMTDSNVASEPLRSHWRRLLKKILLARLMFKRAAGFLTSGLANEQFYKTYGVPEGKMARVPFSWGYKGLLAKAEQLKPQRESLRTSLGIREADFVLLYVGRLSKEKRPFDPVEAYSQVAWPKKRLFFVGDGPLRPQLERRVCELGLEGVHFAGFQMRRDLPKFYTVADALVLPSHDETWGIVVNEALCFGLPVMASDRVGASSDLIRDGYNGFIFPAGDVEHLAGCIDRLIHLSVEERLAFRTRSVEIIKQWIKIDPAENVLQLLKAIKASKYGSG